VITDLLVGFLSFLFTLMILSYLVGDNPLFRVAVHIFVGVTAGYAGLIIWQQVIINKLLAPMLSGDWVLAVLFVFPLLMGFFLLTKAFPKYQGWGTWVVAFLVGVGAAATIGGAITGTLFPQTWASINLFDFSTTPSDLVLEKIVEGLLILIGTITTLAYFQFSVRQSTVVSGKRNLFMRIISQTGEVFLAITFGALFAGVLASALAALVNRMQAIVDFFASFFL
jgi:hypothetical protein